RAEQFTPVVLRVVEQPHHARGDLLDRLAQAGQAGADHRGGGAVVETGERHVDSRPQAAFLERRVGAQRDRVVGGDQRGGRVVGVEQGGGCLAPVAVLVGGPGDQPVVDVRAVLGAGPAPAPLAVVADRVALLQPEEADPGVPLHDQVLDGLRGSAGAVDVDPRAGLRLPGPDPTEGGEGNPPVAQPRVPGVADRGVAEHEPVHRAARQQVLVDGEAFLPVGSGEQQQVPAGALHLGGQRAQVAVHEDVDRPVLAFGDAVADEAAGAGAQGAGLAVRPVAEFVDHPLDPAQRVGVQLLRRVDRVRDGLPRHTSAFSDLFQRRCPGHLTAPPLWTGSARGGRATLRPLDVNVQISFERSHRGTRLTSPPDVVKKLSGDPMPNSQQPALHELTTPLSAPNVVLSSPIARITCGDATGAYRDERRSLAHAEFAVPTADLVAVDSSSRGAQARVQAVDREHGDTTPAPGLHYAHDRAVTADSVRETLTLHNASEKTARLTVILRAATDLARMDQVKAGEEPALVDPSASERAAPWEQDGGSVRLDLGAAAAE